MNENENAHMKAKLKEHIDLVFAKAPRGQRVEELREEMLQDLSERYDDKIAAGYTPAAAYHAAITSVGDVSALLAEFGKTSGPASASSPTAEAVKETPATPDTAPASAPNTTPEASAPVVLDPAHSSGATSNGTATGARPRPTVPPLSEEEKEQAHTWKMRHAFMTALAVSLYILCVVPTILFSDILDVLGVVLMFTAIAAASALLIFANNLKPAFMSEKDWYLGLDHVSKEEARRIKQEWHTQDSVITSVAVALYICCWIPAAVLDVTGIGWLEDVLAPCLLFVMIAVATGLLIYHGLSKPDVMKYKGLIDGTAADATAPDGASDSSGNPQEAPAADVAGNDDDLQDTLRPRSGVYKIVSSMLWILTFVAYFAISFLFGGWAYTWLLFLISVALDNVIKATFDLFR